MRHLFIMARVALQAVTRYLIGEIEGCGLGMTDQAGDLGMGYGWIGRGVYQRDDLSSHFLGSGSGLGVALKTESGNFLRIIGFAQTVAIHTGPVRF